jgi:hypothetical protein
LYDIALAVAHLQRQCQTASIAAFGNTFVRNRHPDGQAIAGKQRFAEVPLPGQRGHGGKTLRCTVLQTVNQDQPQEAMRDAPWKSE